MIRFKMGDILAEDAEALVNTVNCVGVMGRGIALQFKNTFPENFKAYATACKRDEVHPGEMHMFETNMLTNPKFIVNFPTKRHWRGKSRIEDIEAGLVALVEEIRARQIRSIAVPPLGSGLGGLEWMTVRSLIEKHLEGLENVDVIVFEPRESRDVETIARNREVPAMTEGRAALVALIRRYLDGCMDPSMTLLEIHKLLYFMQEAGEPLKLRYTQAPYGPYAENLRHVLNRIEGHLISGYADGGDAPDKVLELVPGADRDAEEFLQDRPLTRERIERVADLVDGFESPAGLELLSTVKWIASETDVQSTEDVITRFHAWNERKRMFTSRQIKIAHQTLTEKNWLS